jgi:hypothetical protein
MFMATNPSHHRVGIPPGSAVSVAGQGHHMVGTLQGRCKPAGDAPSSGTRPKPKSACLRGSACSSFTEPVTRMRCRRLQTRLSTKIHWPDSGLDVANLSVGHPSAITFRALQKYMHEFHVGRDHALCNSQNRFIPVVQLTQLRKLSNKTFKGTGESQKLTVLPST